MNAVFFCALRASARICHLRDCTSNVPFLSSSCSHFACTSAIQRFCATTTTSQSCADEGPFQSDSSDEVQALYRFLEEQECEGTECLAIGYKATSMPTETTTSERLRGLFATRDFAEGEFVFAIPLPATLLIQETYINPDKDHDADGKETDDAEMQQAIALLQNFVEEPSSIWGPYLRCLPRVESSNVLDATPDFWPSHVLDRFPVPLLQRRSRERYQRIRRASKKGPYSTQDLQWALWIIRTRGFTSLKQCGTMQGKLRERTVLLPLIDMINHDGEDPNVSIQVIETDSYDESFVALQAQRSIAEGEQISLRYGTGFETSLELLDKYGFYTRDNPNDGRIDWDLVDEALLCPEQNSEEADPTLDGIRRFCEHLRSKRPT